MGSVCSGQQRQILAPNMKFFAALLASAAVASAKVVLYSDGILREAKTPKVLELEDAHFAAHGIKPQYTGTGVYVAYSIPGFPYGLPGHPGLVEHSNGAIVPKEPAELLEARAKHLKAHADA